MSERLWLDLETRSRIDLMKTSVYRYTECPDFKILMASWSNDGETVQTAFTPAQIKNIPGLWDSGVVKVAHNAQFERVCLSRFAGLTPGTYLPAEEFYDTQALAAEHGWPQKLANLSPAIGADEAKDEAGTRLINLFCKPNRKGEWNTPETHPEEWLDFIAYCEQDVSTLIAIDKMLPSWPNRMEREIYLADQAINDRGIAIDITLAQDAVRAAEENQAEQLARVSQISGVENPNSVPQMGEWLRREGIKAPNLQAATVEALLEGEELTDVQREVLELRQELALVASKKFASALYSTTTGDRLRGTLQFFGAHTGRWAGRGTQIQNLPRLAFDNEADTELTIGELRAGERVSAPDLKRLVRPMFTGPFTVVDYSAIEARVIAWLAGEQWALDAFAAGRDIYVETGTRMGGLSRSQGKIAVLGLGYAGGVNTLKALGGIPGMDDDGLQTLVTQWRKANPRIVRLWTTLGDRFVEPGPAGPHLTVSEEHDNLGRCLKVHLPSGRAITYHDVRWERYVVTDPKTKKTIRKEGWRFANPKDPFNHKMRVGTYGGSLTENATQAVARDIMGEALVRLESRGYEVVGHVHDEILVQGEHDVEEIKAIMTEPPSWSDGLPIDGEGFTCRRYRKG